MKHALHTELENLVKQAIISLPYEFKARSMFGGLLLYVNTKPLAVIANGKLGIKLDPFLFDDYKERGALAFAFSPKDVSKQYLEVPKHILDEPKSLTEWFAEGANYIVTKHKAK